MSQNRDCGSHIESGEADRSTGAKIADFVSTIFGGPTGKMLVGLVQDRVNGPTGSALVDVAQGGINGPSGKALVGVIHDRIGTGASGVCEGVENP